MNNQREHASSNTFVGNEFEKTAFKCLSKEFPKLINKYSIEIGYLNKKKHNFDIGCRNPKLIVECKSHTWTKSDNIPSAKMTTWDQAMLYFYLAPRSYRKIFFVLKDWNEKKKETLCDYYLRTHYHLIPDEVEFWEYDEKEKKATIRYVEIK